MTKDMARIQKYVKGLRDEATEIADRAKGDLHRLCEIDKALRRVTRAVGTLEGVCEPLHPPNKRGPKTKSNGNGKRPARYKFVCLECSMEMFRLKMESHISCDKCGDDAPFVEKVK